MKRRTTSILLAFVIIFTPLLTGFSDHETTERTEHKKHKMLIDQGNEIDKEESFIDQQRLTLLRQALEETGKVEESMDHDLKQQAADLQESVDGITTTQEEKSYRNIEMLKDTLTGSQQQQTALQEYITIYEEEPNDRFDQANPIKLNSDVVGNITNTRYDMDRFKFTVEVPGILETSGIWIGDYYDLGWEDDMYFGISKAGNETEYIASAQYYSFADGTGMRHLEVYLDKGEYFITLYASDEFDDLYVWEPYVLFMDFFPNIEGELPIFYEEEPNDWIFEANKIVPYTSVIGWINHVSYDMDYFEIELDRPGYLSIGGIWVGEYYDWGWEDDLYIAVVNEADEIIYAADLYRFDDGTAMVYMEEEVKAGTYYIVVFANQDFGDIYVGEPYIFNVYFESTGDEHRISGSNRYLTAYEIAKVNNPNPETVILVRGDDVNGIPQVVDGLTASGLAGAKGAQILLTQQHRLTTATEEALLSLQPKKVIIVGGEGAVGQAVVESLQGLINKGLPLEIQRVSGSNRYATAAEVALEIEVTQNNTAIIVNGTSEVDSLVAGPLAHKGYPILMVNNARGVIPKETLHAISTLGIENLLIVGGYSVVSQNIEDQLNAIKGVSVQNRYGGSSRVETSILLAKHAAFNENPQFSLVNGLGYVDAVGASTLQDPVIYILPRQGITDGLALYIKGKESFRAIGGKSVLPDELMDSVKALLK